jgi:hypothetical protein
MALTKNQLRWADIYIKNENDRKQIVEGKNPLDMIKKILDSPESHLPDKGGKKRAKDIVEYLKETTVPI